MALPAADPQFILNLSFALLLGTAIGFERQWRQRMAGIRTNALVSIGAAMFTVIPDMIDRSSDPTRMASQVITGIGFLGAGLILREGFSIKGLDTAATLWCSAAVGTLAGFGLLVEAAIGAFFILVVNLFLRPISKRFHRQLSRPAPVERKFRIRIICLKGQELETRSLILQSLHGRPLRLRSLSTEEIPGADRVALRVDLEGAAREIGSVERFVNRMSLERSVHAIQWNQPEDEAA